MKTQTQVQDLKGVTPTAKEIKAAKALKAKKAKDALIVKPAKVKRLPTQKVITNRNWKKNTFSLSALKRYINDGGVNGGKKDFLKELALQNAKYGTNISIAQATTIARLKAVSTIRDFNHKDGTDKIKFSLWLFLLGIGRMCRAEVASAKVKKAA